MPIHSNKYYQLIKVLRMQKQKTEQKQLHNFLKRENQLHLSAPLITEHIIAAAIDADSAQEHEDRDRKRADSDSLLAPTLIAHSRLWEAFLKEACFKTVTAQCLPMHRKMALQSDEQLIERLLKEGEAVVEKNKRQMESLTAQIRQVNETILQLQQRTHELEKEKEEWERAATKLKADFDAEDKKINERSAKYKVEKSTDLMFKNINKEDQEMRRAMASRIKLNQELDLGFQLQRRRAFNQAKQANSAGRQKVVDKISKLMLEVQQHRSQQQKWKDNRQILGSVNATVRKETVYFLKQLIKQFEMHSKGIEWMVRLLAALKYKITPQDLPQHLTNIDRQFIQQLFTQTTPTPAPTPTPLVRPTSRRHRDTARLEGQFKTQPHLMSKEHSQKHFSCMERTKTEMKQSGEMTVHFDIERSEQEESKGSGSRAELSQRVNLNSKSLKKIYESTGQMISKLLKNKEWNYESCKVMTMPSQEPTSTHCGKAQIEEKIRQRFSSVRQIGRRNNVRRLLFGDKPIS